MIAKLENYKLNGFMVGLIKFSVIKQLHAKFKFGMLINLCRSLINTFSYNAKKIAAQLHKFIRHKLFRRKVIV